MRCAALEPESGVQQKTSRFFFFFANVLSGTGRWPWTTCDVQHAARGWTLPLTGLRDSGGATTVSCTVNGANTVSSFVMRSVRAN